RLHHRPTLTPDHRRPFGAVHGRDLRHQPQQAVGCQPVAGLPRPPTRPRHSPCAHGRRVGGGCVAVGGVGVAAAGGRAQPRVVLGGVQARRESRRPDGCARCAHRRRWTCRAERTRSRHHDPFRVSHRPWRCSRQPGISLVVGVAVRRAGGLGSAGSGVVMVGRERWGWAVVSAATGTIGIAAGAFWLSFIALADLAARSGVTVGQAWVWPLLVDGLIVVATVAVVALDRHRAAWYPWSLLIAGALVSVTANAAHALVAADAAVPGVLASVVAAVPPLVLLASTHLTVVLIRSTTPDRATADALDVSAAAVPARAAEPVVAATPSTTSPSIPEPDRAPALPVPIGPD